MKKLFLLLSFFTGLLIYANAQDNGNWESFLPNSQIKSVTTFRDYAYIIPKNGGFYVLDKVTGQIEHHHANNSPLEENIVKSLAITSDSTLYIASDKKSYIVKNGEWKVHYSGSFSTPEVFATDHQDNVYMHTSWDTVFVLNQDEEWDYHSEADITWPDQFTVTNDGHMFLLSPTEVLHYDGSSWSEINIFGTFIHSIDYDSTSNEVWISHSDGIHRFKDGTWEFISDLSATSLKKTDTDTLLILNRYDDELQKLSISSNVTKSLLPAESSDGSVANSRMDSEEWFYYMDGGTLYYGNEEEIKSIGLGDYGLPMSKVTSFLLDSKGTMWIGTQQGLTSFDGTETHFYTMDYSSDSTLQDYQIYSLGEDQEGNIWIGGPNYLHKYADGYFKTIQTEEASDFYQFNDIEVDDDNNIYLAGSAGIWHLIDDSTANLIQGSPTSAKKLELTESGGIWALTSDGLHFFEDGTWTTYNSGNSGLLNDNNYDIELDAFGNLWIGGSDLQMFNKYGFTTFHYQVGNIQTPWISDISIDKYGNKWLALQSYGLMRFDGDSAWHYNMENSGISTNYLSSSSITRDGKLWIGSSSYGVSSFEIPSTFNTSNIIKGFAFYDENGNKTFDRDEYGIANRKITTGSASAITGTNGGYNIFLKDTGMVSLSAFSDDIWTSDFDMSEVDFTDSTELELNIPYKKNASVYELDYSLTHDFPRCNRDVSHSVNVVNTGSEILDVMIMVKADAGNFTEITSADSVKEGNIYYNIKDVTPGDKRQVRFDYFIDQLEGTYQLPVEVAYSSPENTVVYDTIEAKVRCAYDPNDKLVSPAGIMNENYVLFDTPLNYTIRFQNTGNDTAFTVKIVDTIPSTLDMENIKVTGSSHPAYTMMEDSVITFVFEDILLPDSNVNEPASHGFISFIIEPDESMDENTVVNNFADIYFDFNPPIRTNTTKSTFVSAYPEVLSSNPKEKEGILAYPNPVQEKLYFGKKVDEVVAYNTAGLQVLNEADVDFISVSALPKGIYIIRTRIGDAIHSFKINKY